MSLRAESKPPTVIEKISAVYASLNEAEKRVADLFQHAPDQTKRLPILRVSELADVSQATVVRFCRSVGFEGYRDFKMELLEESGTRQTVLPVEHTDIAEEDDTAAMIRKVVAIDTQAIADTLGVLDPREVDHAVRALTDAQAVAAFGLGGSLGIVMDLYYRLLRSGVHSRISVDSHMQAINAAMLGPEDVGIFVSHTGETADVLECLDAAKRQGAVAIGITGSPWSTLGTRCDIRLATSSVSARWINDAVAARMAQLAIVDVLCVGVARRKDPKELLVMQERIEDAATRKRGQFAIEKKESL